MISSKGNIALRQYKVAKSKYPPITSLERTTTFKKMLDANRIKGFVPIWEDRIRSMAQKSVMTITNAGVSDMSFTTITFENPQTGPGRNKFGKTNGLNHTTIHWINQAGGSIHPGHHPSGVRGFATENVFGKRLDVTTWEHNETVRLLNFCNKAFRWEKTIEANIEVLIKK